MTSPKTIQLNPHKKIYFASDFHLGAPDYEQSLLREKKIVRWLESIRLTTEALFLVGDIFDFWFEYRHAIPKGYTRLLGKLAEFTDQGIPVYFFIGNHDMWMFDYFPKELGIPVYREPQVWMIENKKFLIGHGDGLGPGDRTYKILKKIFRNPLCQWLFARLHPNFGIGLASYFSCRSRAKNIEKGKDKQFFGEDEWLVQYCKEVEQSEHHDYYIFGHRHLPLDIKIGDKSRYVNLGEWLTYDTYASFDGKDLMLNSFGKAIPVIL